MRVVHLQYLVAVKGNAPLRLHNAMREAGIDSCLCVFNTQMAGSRTLIRFGGFRRHIKTLIYGLIHGFIRRNISENPGLYSFPFGVGNNVTSIPEIKEADVIYLHWVNGGFLSLSNIAQILEMGKPVFFFMHDMWPFTGGCHHSFSCNAYTSGCRECPMFAGPESWIYPRLVMRRKGGVYANSNLRFIAPSSWMKDRAERSSVLKEKQVFRVPNFIDNKIFKKTEKEVARNILAIPKSTRMVISFGCVAGFRSPIKGWKLFVEALQRIHRQEPLRAIEVMIFGSGESEEVRSELPYPVRFMGEVGDEVTMALIDSASDVFVSPSLAESFGMTVLENILCGTPVVTFNNGGVTDFVIHKVNGYLADYMSVEDLANGILYCLDNSLSMLVNQEFLSGQVIDQHRKLIDGVVS